MSDALPPVLPTTVVLHRPCLVRFALGALLALEESSGRGLFDIADEIRACAIKPSVLGGVKLSDEQIAKLSKEDQARLEIDENDAANAGKRLKLSTIFQIVAAGTGSDVDHLKANATAAQVMAAWPTVASHFFRALSAMSKEPSSGETPAVATEASCTA